MPILNFIRDSMALTILGWSPGLRAIVGGRVLPCGCLTGTYQTCRSEIVVILDAPGRSCRHAHHRQNVVLWKKSGTCQMVPFDEPSSSADFA